MTALITEPGIVDMPEADYHADPCPAPSLSASIAKIIAPPPVGAGSMRHAWQAHPRLNPAFEPENSHAFNIGKAAHALVLGDVRQFVIIDAESYGKKADQAARDEAYEAGAVPLLVPQWRQVQNIAAAVRAQLDVHDDDSAAFVPGLGKPEQSLFWREGDIWCRARFDWMPHAGNVFYDFKTTGQSAHPDEWQRQAFKLGYNIQAAFYLRGLKALRGIEGAHFRFVVVEADPPHALSVVEMKPHAMERANMVAEYAIGWWSWCLRHNAWPAYAARTAYIDEPAYIAKAWDEHVHLVEATEEAGEDLKNLMIEWQAPLAAE